MKLGSSIKRIRREKFISQKSLAGLCGISSNALSQIENNSSIPRSETLNKIAESLNVSKSYILLMALNENDVSPDRREVFKAVKEVLITLFR